MRILISFFGGKRRLKALQCYLTLILWLIIFSIGLYWLMTRREVNINIRDSKFLNILQMNDNDNDKFGQGGHSHAGQLKLQLSKNNNYMFLEDSNQIGGGDDGGGNGNGDQVITPELDHDHNELERLRKRQQVFNLLKVQPKKSIFDTAGQGQQGLGLDQVRKISKSNKKKSTSSIDRLCNRPDTIMAKDEFSKSTKYKLKALIILFRHGDRGPLSHVFHRNISNLNCSAGNHTDFINFSQYIGSDNQIGKFPGFSQFIGPFSGFPRFPAQPQCLLGQLTQQGAVQLIKLGQSLRKAYDTTGLGLIPLSGGNGLGILQNSTNNVQYHELPKLVAYSTRYRRTFQSLLAFLWGFFDGNGKNIVGQVQIRESQSINFCFNDCSCRGANRLKKFKSSIIEKPIVLKPVHSNLNSNLIQKHKIQMADLVEQINSIIGGGQSSPGVGVDQVNDKPNTNDSGQRKSGKTLLDLLLVYPCHNSPMPCNGPDCISRSDLATLIELLQKENELQNSDLTLKFSLLSTYGLLKEILALALKMTSDDLKSKTAQVSLFSAHDSTLEQLTTALGLRADVHQDVHLPPYASRFIFEFYSKISTAGTGTDDEPLLESGSSAKDSYFRIVYNGEEITNHISFCRSAGPAGEKSFCPLENLIRFLHDHYFEPFGNITNMRDACSAAGSLSGSKSNLNSNNLKKRKKKR